MQYKKREAELERKFYKNRMDLVALSATAPINKQIVLRLSCLAWEFKQSYKGEDAVGRYYVRKSSYKDDLQRILDVEKKLIQGGEYEPDALKAISEAKEYLWMVTGSRMRVIVPDNSIVY